MPHHPTQLLTFVVAGVEYGVDILRVREIRGWTRPMPMPHTPPCVKGVINVRGDIIPITDLRERLGLDAQATSATSAIVVVHVEHEEGARVCGFVVDAMSDVTDLQPSHVQPPPEVSAGDEPALVRGIVISGDKLTTILDVDRVFARTLGASAHLSPLPETEPAGALR